MTNHFFKKHFGQNFLVDQNILAVIAREAMLHKDDWVLEIGAGQGALTETLATQSEKILALEVDNSLIAPLKTRFAHQQNVHILEADVLATDLALLLAQHGYNTHPWKCIANLPYNIGTQVLQRVLSLPHPPQHALLMLQSEVIDKILATPPAMEYLAVFTQFYATPTLVKRVSRHCFLPKPKVTSALVRLDQHPPPINPDKHESFFALVKAGFAHKRKTLLQSLSISSALFTSKENLRETFAQTGWKHNIRAQELSIDDWVQLFTYL